MNLVFLVTPFVGKPAISHFSFETLGPFKGNSKNHVPLGSKMASPLVLSLGNLKGKEFAILL